MTSRVLFSANRTLDHEPLSDGAVTTGVWQAPVDAPECGLWEHSEGVSTDVEVHEVFVVISGSARIEVEGQDDLVVGPGDVVELQAGARTVWHVTQPLRKFWVLVPA